MPAQQISRHSQIKCKQIDLYIYIFMIFQIILPDSAFFSQSIVQISRLDKEPLEWNKKLR